MPCSGYSHPGFWFPLHSINAVLLCFCILVDWSCATLIGVFVRTDQAILMQELRNGMVGTGNTLSDWVVSNECKLWTGVECSQNGLVRSIVLSDWPTPVSPNVTLAPTLALGMGKEIDGEILRVVGKLYSLEHLVICNTRVSGAIPTSINSLKNLKTLVLSSNNLSGRIPSFTENLKGLKTLNLSNNHISGPIPGSIGVLNSLQILDLSLNAVLATASNGIGVVKVGALNESIPFELRKLTNLVILSLHGNLLSGYCPSLSSLINIVQLNTSLNQLTGDISKILGLHPNLEYLDMSYNSFYGEIPSALGNSTSLKFLDLEENQAINGSIPDFLFQIDSIESIILGSNSLQGMLPSSLNLPNIINLRLGNNNFSGQLPSSFGTLSKLETLEVDNNELEGPIPDFSLSQKLQQVDLSSNGFTGEINTFGNVKSLQILILDFVNVSAPIPFSITELKSLQTFSCKQCFLTGHIPDTIGNLQQLLQLDLSGNNLTGVIPSSIGNLTSLELLYLQNNKLTGSIPSSLFNTAKSLSDLQLYENELSGNIPSWLGSMSNLGSLILRDNSFSGSIPSEIGNISTLSVLDLSSNSLTGSIPSSFGSLSCLTKLFLNSNQLGGVIPVEICYLTKLQILEIRDTAIQGTLPAEFTNLTALTNLAISMNSLQGFIPVDFLSNFTSLITLDLSYTSFEGTIPSISTLTSLQSLVLKNNRFNGDLPSSFPSSLFDLDISNNDLTGNLSALTSCISLSTLVADNNSLSGDLPNFPNASLVSLYANNLSESSVSNFSGKLHWDLAGNPICSSSQFISSPVCDQNETSLNYEAPTFCTNLTCLGEMKPNPMLYANSGACICSPPVTFSMSISPSYITVFTENTANTLQKFFSKIASTSASLVEVQSAVSDSSGKMLISVQLFGSGASVPIKSISGIWNITKAEYPGRFIPNIGYVQVSSYTIAANLQATGSEAVATAITGVSERWIILCSCLAFMAIVLTLLIVRWNYGVLRRQTSFAIRVQDNFVKFIPLKDIVKATHNFSKSNILGQGGYGTVYIGKCPNGELWAVKRAKTISKKGLVVFQTEVDIISRMNHANIVKLLGYCDEHNEQILVYEYMPNGTVKGRLAKSKSRCVLFSFEDRLETAIAAAEGLRYLHTFAKPTIIHRDVKSDNILFDQTFTPKLADFGLLLDKLKSTSGRRTTHSIVGTPGYIDPEYFQSFRVTTKSDVYSFGVLLLELISGQSALIRDSNFLPQEPGHLINLTQWALQRRSNPELLVDGNMGEYNKEAMAMLVQVAFACVEKLGENRPDMDEVCRKLNDIREEARGAPNSREIIWRSTSSATATESSDVECFVDSGANCERSPKIFPLLYNSGSSFSQMSTLVGGR